MDRTNKSGQALLIIFLAMATITTVVLSVTLRSVTEVEVTNLEEDSLRAFTAAEAGLEEALVAGQVGDTFVQDIELPSSGTNAVQPVISNYQTDVSGYPSNSNEFEYPFELFSGDSASIWLVTRENNEIVNDCTVDTPCYNAADPITICWGIVGTNANNNQTPALEVTFVYQNAGGEYHSTRSVHDPNSSRRNANNFRAASSGGCTIAGESFQFRRNVNLGNLGIPPNLGSAKLMKVRLLYNTNNPHTFGVMSQSAFPAQGTVVTSTGQSGNSTRKIEAYSIQASTPSVFDSALYSGRNIAK